MVEKSEYSESYVNKDSEIDLQKEKEGKKLAWQELFTELDLAARNHNADITKSVIQDSFDIIDNDDIYFMRIHAFFKDRHNHPTHINISIYHNDEHTQTVEALAVWKRGKPEFLESNIDNQEVRASWYSEREITDNALTIILVNSGFQAWKNENSQKQSIFPTPGEFFRNTH